MVRLAVGCIMFMCVMAHAQMIDSIPSILRGKRSFDARFESRYSFVNHELIKVNGVRAGITWQRKLRAGIGVSWLDVPVFLQASSAEVAFRRELMFAYFCSYVDVVFHKTKRWQLSVPVQAGAGATWFLRNPEFSFGDGATRYLLLLYEPGITVQFKIFTWLGLGSDLAYRFAWNANRSVRGTLNSPTYSFKVLFWPGFLYFDLFPESKISKQFGPSNW